MTLILSTGTVVVGGITMTRAAALDYARRDAEHRKAYPTPAGGLWEGVRRSSPDRLAGTAWRESSGSSTYVVFDGSRVTASFEGSEAHRRASEFVKEFGGVVVPAYRR